MVRPLLSHDFADDQKFGRQQHSVDDRAQCGPQNPNDCVQKINFRVASYSGLLCFEHTPSPLVARVSLTRNAYVDLGLELENHGDDLYCLLLVISACSSLRSTPLCRESREKRNCAMTKSSQVLLAHCTVSKSYTIVGPRSPSWFPV
jgi:hypothetical protein